MVTCTGSSVTTVVGSLALEVTAAAATAAVAVEGALLSSTMPSALDTTLASSLSPSLGAGAQEADAVAACLLFLPLGSQGTRGC